MLLEAFEPDPRVAKLLRNDIGAEPGDLRWSVFVFPFAEGEERVLYHTLTKQCFRVGEELYDAALAGRTGEMSGEEGRRLAACGFLVPREKDETALYESVQRLLRVRYARTRLQDYTIAVTTACNARCFYCAQEGLSPRTMDEQTLEQTIAFILETRDPGRKIHLRWFGGEPLLASRIIDRVSAALEEAGADFEASMISNGSLIDGQILAKMTGPWRLRRIQISLDGAEEDYERRKAYRGACPGAYRRLLEILGRLSRTQIQVVLRCNVDSGDLEGLQTMVDDLDRAIGKKARVYPYFAVLFDQRDSEEHAALFRRCLQAKRYAHEKGFPYIPQAPLHRARRIACMAEEPCGSVLIGPDGKLYSCEAFSPETETGDVWQGLRRQERLSCALPEPVAERCRDCLFLPNCTSFSRCPFPIRQCREVRRLELGADLAMELRRLERAGDEEPEAVDPC